MKNFKSGSIWTKTNRSRAQIVRRVCEKLFLEYGNPRHANPYNPVDDLIFIIVSNRTAHNVSITTYKSIKRNFKCWDDVIDGGYNKLQVLLRPAGLSKIKCVQITKSLRKIQNDFGICDLSFLKNWSKFKVERYLTSLPGVSLKVAKCVMIYTLGFEVLPVDTHVFRLSKRLGWVDRKRADQCHEELEALILPKYRYNFHVDCIQHGREVCKPISPLCNECCINKNCFYYICV